MYKYRQFGDKFVLCIDNHQKLSAAIAAFCKELEIKAGAVYGIGAVNEATLRFLDPATMKYVDKTFNEQMEIANLTGNISQKDGQVYLHLHAIFGRRDYTCVGGHLLEASLNGACELVVERFDGAPAPGRYVDPETGLNLYEL